MHKIRLVSHACFWYHARVKYRVLLFVLCLGLQGCSLREHLARITAKVESQYEAVQTWDKLPVRTISWQQAVAIMRRNNTELARAQAAINKAEREELSVYTDLIPQVSYYGYFNKTLDSLTRQWSSDDANSNLNVYFSIPTLTQVPYRVYANQAAAFGAVKAKEGRERELISKLYQSVRKHEVEQKRTALERRAPETPAGNTAPFAKDAGDSEYWKNIAGLLGDTSARWQILPETMPHIRWADYEKRLDRLDPLVVCKFALQLEQARLKQYSIALQYLPTINTNLYSPSLFSSSGGTYNGTFLDTKDTRLNMSISYQLDTQLRTWNSYKDNKENYELVKKEVATALMDHKVKVQTLRRSVSEYEAWRSYMLKRMDFLRNNPPPTAAEYIEQEQALLGMEKELITQEERAIESEAALVLEYGMP